MTVVVAVAISARRYGEHILPIFEDPELVKHIIWEQEQRLGAPVPVYWRVSREGLAHPCVCAQVLPPCHVG